MENYRIPLTWIAIILFIIALTINDDEAFQSTDIYYKQKHRRSVFHGRWNPQEKVIVESPENPAVNFTKASQSHPWLKLSMTANLMFNPNLYMCSDYEDLACQDKTNAFKQRVLSIFEKSLEESTNASNTYNVYINLTANEDFEDENYQTSCLLLSANVRVLKRRDTPFDKMALGKLFPKQSLLPNAEKIKSCAIVSSAGSLAGSKLGEFIDSHDIVMRFNNAPTNGYEKDVGSKTNIRILNSQVVSKPEFNFTHSPMFENITIAAWDPGKYNATLNDWLDSYDHNLFQNYEIYRQRYPKSRAFLIDPRSVWRLWRNLQIFTKKHTILTNPPSSGFIGLSLLLPFCPYINFIEYIPSTRLSGRCHYYTREINPTCTFGAWHPLAAEKLMAFNMNSADDMSVGQYGNLHINQPDRNLCELNSKDY